MGLLFNSTTGAIKEKMENINTLLRKHPIQYDGCEIKISISYGVAQFKEEGNSIEDLLKLADERMYQYKKIKKSLSQAWPRVIFYKSASNSLRRCWNTSNAALVAALLDISTPAFLRTSIG